jgi:uncharacterized membrane protein
MTPVQQFERWVDESAGLEKYSLDVQNFARKLFESEGGKKLLSTLNGDWMGHPLHPVMTDMAIGGYTIAWFLDIVAEIVDDDTLRKSADDAMLVGLLSAIPTVITGLSDWTHTEDRSRRLGFVHALTNALGTSLYLASYLSRKNNRVARFWLSQLGAIILTGGAYMGGMLVYREGEGVRPNAKTKTPKSQGLSAQDIQDDIPYSTERYNLP